jgi:hypothetical protein
MPDLPTAGPPGQVIACRVTQLVAFESGRTLVQINSVADNKEQWFWADPADAGYTSIFPLLLACLNTKTPGAVSVEATPDDVTLTVAAKVVWFRWPG